MSAARCCWFADNAARWKKNGFMNSGCRWHRWIGVWLAGLVLSCAGTRTSPVPPTYTLTAPSLAGVKKYPALFCTPPTQAVVGVSFVSRGYAVTDYTRALDRALRQLSWGKRVRVRGEQLFEQTFRGSVPRGQKIDLLEVPSIALEACRVDTLLVDDRAWVSVRLGTEGGWGKWGYFRPDPPGWIETLPRGDKWLYAMGIANAPFKDEAGSWELATYRALIDLAVSVGGHMGHSDRVLDQAVRGASILSVQTRLEGFRVAARWRDDTHLYVLVRVPRSGAISLLEDP